MTRKGIPKSAMTKGKKAEDFFSPHVEISLDSVLHNAAQLKTLLFPGQRILAVVKDCAYGCGSVPITRTLEQYGGISDFAVARAKEAFALRDKGIKGSILVLGRAGDDEIRKGCIRDITFTLCNMEDLQRWAKLGPTVRFHCLFDTGMNRMGLLPEEAGELAKALNMNGTLRCIGAYTHFAGADEPSTSTVNEQLGKFRSAILVVRRDGIALEEVHFSNSAASMRFRSRDCTMIRPGIALYGSLPDPLWNFPLDLRPVASLKSYIVKMKRVPPNTPVSYGGHYVTKSRTWIATIALGYAHGVPRFLSGKGEVLIKGKRYRIAGNVTMDYIMVDAGSNPAIEVGDEAVVIGYQGNDCIRPDEVARVGGTIGYEVLCNLGTAIERRYRYKNKVIEIQKGFVF